MTQTSKYTLQGGKPINQDLDTALKAMVELRQDTTLKPVQRGDKREAILADFLVALGKEFDVKIQRSRIDANGEMNINVDTSEGYGTYGDEFAALISTQPRRTGIYPTEVAMLPENNWCKMNHFSVEKLMEHVRKQLKPVNDLNRNRENGRDFSM